MLGKAELVSWAAEVSAVYPCSKYDDFKDGLVFCFLFDNLFHGFIDATALRVQRSGTRHPKQNWEALRHGMLTVGLPTNVCDRKGIAAGQQRPVYNLLVMFYFLTKLTQSNDFTVDFAHPIDDTLAQFLQSPESLECLSRANPPPAQRGRAPSAENANAMRRSVSPSGPMSPPQHHAPAPTPQPAATPQQQRGELRQDEKRAFWQSTEVAESGEVLVARLQNEVKRCHRRVEHVQAEIEHSRISQSLQLEQQKTLFEMDLTRAQREAGNLRASMELERVGSLNRMRSDMQETLTRLTEEIKIEADCAVFDNPTSPDALRAELTTLRQQHAVATAQMATLRNELRDQRGLAETLQEQHNQTLVAYDRMLQQYKGTTERLGRDILPDVVMETASEADQAAVVNHVRVLRSELNAARANASLFAEELDGLKHRDVAGGTDSADSVVELARLQAQLRKAEGTTIFLRNALQRLSQGDSVLRDAFNDYSAEQLGDGVVAPSTAFKAVSAEELSAAVQLAVSRIQGEGSEVQQLKDSVWKMSCAFAALQHRLDTAASSVHTLDRRLAEAGKQAAVSKHEYETRIADLQVASRRATEDALRASAHEMSQLRLQLDLTRTELDRTRHEATASHDRLQANLTAAMRDAERQMQDMRDRSATVEKSTHALRARDDLNRQLAELQRRAPERMSPADRQLHDMKIQNVRQQLAALGDVAHVESHANESSVQAVTENLRQRLQHCVEELKSAEENAHVRQTEFEKVTLELERTKHQAAIDREARQDAESKVSQLEGQLRHLTDDYASLRTDSEVKLEEMARQYRELQQYSKELGSAVVDSSRPMTAAVPLNTISIPVLPERADTSAAVPWAQRGSAQSNHSAGGGGRSAFEVTMPSPASPIKPTTPPPLAKLDDPSHAGRGSSVLSQEELERRKMEILAKYGVRPS